MAGVPHSRSRARSRRGPRATWLWLIALAALAALGVGLLKPDHKPRPLAATLTSVRLRLLGPQIQPPAPSGLQQRLAELAQAYGEPVGVAVSDISEGWTAGVDTWIAFPQQSVSKLWVAIAVLKAVDDGRLDVDREILLTEADRSVFFQPVAYRIGADGYATSLADLLRRALVESDNAANDRLMLEVGGPEGVAAALTQLNLVGVRVGAYERDLQARTAGLVWRPEYGIGWNFQAARADLPKAERQAALDAYLTDPPDGASPAAITRALTALARGELLSEASTARLLGLMQAARTGPRRLKGGLPPGWSLAHKTGTGPDFQGASVGINDVGLLTAPDGRAYAVAVMLRQTRHTVPERLAFMQSITRAVAESWASEQGGQRARAEQTRVGP